VIDVKNIIHGPQCNRHVFKIVADTVPTTRCGSQYAIETLPANLYVKCSSIPKAGRGVFAKQTIIKNTRFGPYVGKRIPMNNIKGDGSLLHVGGMFLFFRSIGILIVV
jgi:hypothetical protein